MHLTGLSRQEISFTLLLIRQLSMFRNFEGTVEFSRTHVFTEKINDLGYGQKHLAKAMVICV